MQRERRSPGELEAEVLRVLWAADEQLTPGEVQQRLPGDLAYTTVLTILRRLLDKGLVTRSAVPGGRAYRYAASMEQAEHAAERMHAFMRAGHDREAVLARFVGRLDDDERSAIAALLRRRSR